MLKIFIHENIEKEAIFKANYYSLEPYCCPDEFEWLLLSFPIYLANKSLVRVLN